MQEDFCAFDFKYLRQAHMSQHIPPPGYQQHSIKLDQSISSTQGIHHCDMVGKDGNICRYQAQSIHALRAHQIHNINHKNIVEN